MESQVRDAVRSACRLHLLARSLLGLTLSACAPAEVPHYVSPSLPLEHMAEVVVDPRATVLTIDGKALVAPEESNDSPYSATRPEPPQLNTYLEAGCHVIEVDYRETFHDHFKECKRFDNGKTIYNKCPGPRWSDERQYSAASIKFFVRARPPSQYWVTATFTGDEFLPRLVELSPAGEATATFTPNARCP